MTKNAHLESLLIRFKRVLDALVFAMVFRTLELKKLHLQAENFSFPKNADVKNHLNFSRHKTI